MSETSKKVSVKKMKDKKKHPPTMIGWVARAISGVILLALAVTLGVEMLRPYRQTEIIVTPHWDAVRAEATGVLVPATIVNRGTDPVRNLTIYFPGATDDGADFVIPLLGPDEELDVAIGFDGKPDRLEYTVKSYETP